MKSIDVFLRQLGYREYSRYILFHNPFTHERPLLEHLCAVPWQYDQVRQLGPSRANLNLLPLTLSVTDLN